MIDDDDKDWKSEFEKHREQLVPKQDQEAIPCFNKASFIKRMGQGEDWHKLVQANIYLEFVALRLLERELKNPREIHLDRMSFSSRLDLISALGLVPKDIISAVRIISKKRNKVAHDLEFELSDKDIQHIASSLSKDLKEVLEK
ncbi:MAG: hypothetical protein P8O11_07285 [Lentibacter sp.]|uniref:hypothetical protein n=1 Tax=Lentibacter sp. TaxID=2024994 RepID=UPI00261E9156|nr:hypothetical protein [Lentibacter sp.]MDG1289504.1 hypothetical protein [Lentibacter sp.]